MTEEESKRNLKAHPGWVIEVPNLQNVVMKAMDAVH